MKNNPYAGPRPFERGEANFCGREREARELLWLILAERAVLFYAQSGAGKTSLLNARVIPDLEKKGFSVPPVVRVGSDLPPGVEPGTIDNIFVFSALLGLAEGQPVPLEKLPGYTLAAFLNEFYAAPQDTETRRPLVLIIDQFEELFTRHPERWQDGLGFFQQLRQALDTTPGLSVVLAMREDHLAGLDPYLPLLPSQLQARFRLEALDHQQAHEAIEKPARLAGYQFEEGAVRQLVTNLSQIKVQRYGAGGIEEVTADGQYIEPVQLQVVCSQLWSSLEEPQDGLIPWQEVREHGDVTQALTGFYTQSLEQAARTTGVKERELRRWFSERLITPVRTRGLALQGAQDTAGLPNTAVQVLEQAHLIRADLRAGARWYELSHDRLVEPIVQSNRAWEAARQTPLRITARQWQSAKSAGLLYRERILKEARAWASAHPDEVEPYEQEFLDASLQAEQSRIRRRRLYIGGLTIAVTVMVVMTVLTGLMMNSQHEAQLAMSTAETSFSTAVVAQIQAKTQIVAISTAQAQAVTQANIARTAQARAEAQTHVSEYRRLGAQAIANQDRIPNLALLLGIEANRLEDNAETRNALLNILQSKPQLATYLYGYTGWVYSVAFSPDGRTVALGGFGKTIILWDMTTRQPAGELLTGSTFGVNSIAFSPDGKILASGSSAGTIILWDVTTHQPIGKPMSRELLEYSSSEVYSVAFSPDGKILASGIGDDILLWNVATQQQVGESLKGHTSLVKSVAFSPDGKILASGSNDSALILWDLSTHQASGEPFRGHTGGVASIAFSPDGKTLASGSLDSTVRLWDVVTRQPVGEPLRGHTGAVYSVAFSPDGKIVASGSMDNTIRFWNVTTRLPLGEPLKGHSDYVNSIAFSPDGKWLVSGGKAETILWNTKSDQLLAWHTTERRNVVFSPDGKFLASGSDDNNIRLWDVTTHQPAGEPLKGRTFGVESIAFSPDSKILVTGTGEAITLWNVTTHQPVGEPLKLSTELLTGVAFSPDGKILASGIGTTIILWNVTTHQSIGELINRDIPSTYSIAFSPDGKILASGANNTIMLWDVTTRQPIGEPLQGHTSQVFKVAFSPDGKILASGSRDKTIRLWDMATHQPIAEPLKGHTSWVQSLAFRPDGKILASGSADGDIILWDLIIHQSIGVLLTGATRDISSIAFSPDGKLLAYSGENGIFLWDASSTSWRDRACQIANRNLTQAEWLLYLNPDPASYAAEYARRPTCPGLPVP
jgi:WD40 repeat protein